MKHKLKVTISCFLFLYWNEASAADLVFYTDPDEFRAAAGSLSLEDFSGEQKHLLWDEDFGDFRIAIDQSAKTYEGFTFPSNHVEERIVLQTFTPESVTQFNFDESISAFGFDWEVTDTHYHDALELLIDNEAYLVGRHGTGFFGVIATDGVFDQVGLSDVYGGGTLNYAYVDNVLYGGLSTVPIPAAAWLFGSGLIGLIGIARRKKAT